MSHDKRYPVLLVISAVLLLLFFAHSSPFSGNLSKHSITQEKVMVSHAGPSQERAPSAAPSGSTLPVFPLNINKANQEELMLLPGIGEKTAQRIVEKRAELKGFRTVDDLTAVMWIGKVKLEKLRAYVTVGGPAGPSVAEPKEPSRN